MSPLLSERWRIALSVDGWARSSCSRRSGIHGDIQLVKTSADEASIASLSSWLTSAKDVRKRIEFSLSNRFCRYAVLAWEPSIRSHEDLDVLAYDAMEPLIDGPLDDWVIRLSPVRLGRSCVVCAIPNNLIESLYGACQSARSSVASISPLLPMALNKWMKSSEGGNHVFACVESDHLLALGVEQGEFLWVRAFTTPSNLTDVVPMLLRQQRIAGQRADASISLTIVGDEGGRDWKLLGAKVHVIPGQSPASAMLNLECR